jgi:hypothetical protein
VRTTPAAPRKAARKRNTDSPADRFTSAPREPAHLPSPPQRGRRPSRRLPAPRPRREPGSSLRLTTPAARAGFVPAPRRGPRRARTLPPRPRRRPVPAATSPRGRPERARIAWGEAERRYPCPSFPTSRSTWRPSSAASGARRSKACASRASRCCAPSSRPCTRPPAAASPPCVGSQSASSCSSRATSAWCRAS